MHDPRNANRSNREAEDSEPDFADEHSRPTYRDEPSTPEKPDESAPSGEAGDGGMDLDQPVRPE